MAGLKWREGGGSASDEQLLPLARMSKLKGGRAAIEADQIPGLAWKAGSPRSAWSDSTKKLRAALEECRWWSLLASIHTTLRYSCT